MSITTKGAKVISYLWLYDRLCNKHFKLLKVEGVTDAVCTNRMGPRCGDLAPSLYIHPASMRSEAANTNSSVSVKKETMGNSLL